MKSIITFEDCDTPEKLQKLNEFAKTFDPPHAIYSHPGNRVIKIVKSNGVPIGYTEMIYVPIVFTAWSKEFTKPQDIWEAMKAFCGWAKIQYGVGYTTVPLDTRNFPQRVMEKLGFYRAGVELYKCGNGE